MPGREGLGETYNAAPLADGAWVSLKGGTSIDFLCFLAGAVGDTYTLQEAKDASGTGAQNLAKITAYHTSTGNGSDTWLRRTQAAAAAVVTPASAVQNAAVINVRGEQLSDGYSYVKVTSTGAGQVVALLHHLNQQRAAALLPALGV